MMNDVLKPGDIYMVESNDEWYGTVLVVLEVEFDAVEGGEEMLAKCYDMSIEEDTPGLDADVSWHYTSDILEHFTKIN